jgi:hypothetical protein
MTRRQPGNPPQEFLGTWLASEGRGRLERGAHLPLNRCPQGAYCLSSYDPVERWSPCDGWSVLAER